MLFTFLHLLLLLLLFFLDVSFFSGAASPCSTQFGGTFYLHVYCGFLLEYQTIPKESQVPDKEPTGSGLEPREACGASLQLWWPWQCYLTHLGICYPGKVSLLLQD